MSQQARTFQMIQLDVFTSRALEGNPLAVFPDARGLSDASMQALAKEMNLSETTFILPREAAVERECGIRVRIFTVEEELPFAGHPTLGTAMAIHNQRLQTLPDGTAAGDRSARGEQDVVWLDLNAGKLPVRFTRESEGAWLGEMQQLDPQFGPRHAADDVSRATGLRLEDFDPDLPIETVSTGLPFTIVPLRSLEVMRRLKVDLAGSMAYLERTGGKFFYFVSRGTVNPESRLHARMFFYNGEDPATGSAAGCACAWMVAHGVSRPEETAVIEQGIETGRPSRILVRASRAGGKISRVRVAGNAVEVMRAEVFV